MKAWQRITIESSCACRSDHRQGNRCLPCLSPATSRTDKHPKHMYLLCESSTTGSVQHGPHQGVHHGLAATARELEAAVGLVPLSEHEGHLQSRRCPPSGGAHAHRHVLPSSYRANRVFLQGVQTCLGMCNQATARPPCQALRTFFLRPSWAATKQLQDPHARHCALSFSGQVGRQL